jgi:hypothetical protein
MELDFQEWPCKRAVKAKQPAGKAKAGTRVKNFEVPPPAPPPQLHRSSVCPFRIIACHPSSAPSLTSRHPSKHPPMVPMAAFGCLRGDLGDFEQEKFRCTKFVTRNSHQIFRTVLRKPTKFFQREIYPTKNLRRFRRHFFYFFIYGSRKKPTKFFRREICPLRDLIATKSPLPSPG